MMGERRGDCWKESVVKKSPKGKNHRPFSVTPGVTQKEKSHQKKLKGGRRGGERMSLTVDWIVRKKAMRSVRALDH